MTKWFALLQQGDAALRIIDLPESVDGSPKAQEALAKMTSDGVLTMLEGEKIELNSSDVIGVAHVKKEFSPIIQVVKQTSFREIEEPAAPASTGGAPSA